MRLALPLGLLGFLVGFAWVGLGAPPWGSPAEGPGAIRQLSLAEVRLLAERGEARLIAPAGTVWPRASGQNAILISDGEALPTLPSEARHWVVLGDDARGWALAARLARESRVPVAIVPHEGTSWPRTRTAEATPRRADGEGPRPH